MYISVYIYLYIFVYLDAYIVLHKTSLIFLFQLLNFGEEVISASHEEGLRHLKAFLGRWPCLSETPQLRDWIIETAFLVLNLIDE